MPRYRKLFRVRRKGPDGLRRELDEELRTHIELRIEELMAHGMSREDAEVAAERRFGDIDAAREAIYASARHREARLNVSRVLEELARDFKLALRRVLRSPGHSAVSVGILGIGIALTTSMFAIVDHVLLRALPFPDADRLVALHSVPESGPPFSRVSMGNWVDWREGIDGLEATGLYREERESVTIGTDAFRADAALVTGDFFRVFRPTMTAGRPFTSDESQERSALAVGSAAFAQRHFGGADLALGEPITVGGDEHRIVGVVEDAQALPERTEVWIPRAFRPQSGQMRNNINWEAIALIEGTTEVEQVQSQATAVARGIRERDPAGIYSYGVAVLPLHDVMVADTRRALVTLMVAVGGVLLAVCANLAGLGIARARQRSSEIAVRMALGSGRLRIARELVAEYVLLGLIGGAAGVVLAFVGGGVLFDAVASTVPRADFVELDVRVGLFALVVSLTAGLVSGLAPALGATRSIGQTRTARGGIRTGRGLPGGLMVSAEVALALVLLVGGGLLFRSFQSVVGRDLGYDPAGVVTADIALSTPEYEDRARGVEYWTTLLAALEEIPQVSRAAVGNWIPTGGGGTSFLALPDDPNPGFGGGYRVVSEHYFDALAIDILEGRTFDARDGPGTERVTLVNRALADLAWPGERALGRRISAPSMEGWMYQGNAPWLTVIGVVEDIRHYGYEAEARPELFVLYRQVPEWTTAMAVVVRPNGAPWDRLIETVRATARAIDPALAVEVASLEERVGGLLEDRVVTMRILIGFAASALFLMCLGIYGLVSYAASLRTRELAIRAALGARKSGLLRLMLVSVTRVVVLGGVVGASAAYLLSGFVEALLVDVPSTDPLTYAAAVTVLVGVALLAALVPSVRAARMDPVSALSSP